MNSENSFFVSSCGHKIWGVLVIQSSEYHQQSKVIMMDLRTASEMLYDYDHQKLAESVMASESKHVVLSGGIDERLVLHDLSSGKTLRIFDMKYGTLSSLCRFGNTVAIGDQNMIYFIDLESKQKLDTETVTTSNCMICSIKSALDEKEEVSLFVGGVNFGKVDKIRLTKGILEKSK